MKQPEILIVDDEIGIRELLSEILEDEGYKITLAENAVEARAHRAQNEPTLVLLDIWMPDTDGVTLLKEWAANGLLTMPVVMMSGHGTIETAVEATRLGAFDFLEKPIALQKLLDTVARAIKHGEAKGKLKLQLDALGKGPLVEQLRQRLEPLVAGRRPILLIGEPGTGHTQCARAIVQAGAAWVGLETGQKLVNEPIEVMQQARGGVLFCEEIGAYHKTEQKALSFVVAKAEKFDVQVVCATSYTVESLANDARFDPSVLAALSPHTITLPPLRNRRDDIPGLAEMMLSELVELRQAPARTFSPEALDALKNAAWPGNLSQLRATINSIAVTAAHNPIEADDVQRVLGQEEDDGSAALARFFELPLREAREAFERLYFQHLLSSEQTNMSRVAEKAGLERTHLYRKLKQLNVRFSRKTEEVH